MKFDELYKFKLERCSPEPLSANDLEITIENPKGSYKQFVDSIDEYPILGVTFPTDYGFLNDYRSEDGVELDVFVGSGDLFGYIKMFRPEEAFPDNTETKTFVNVTCDELEEIKCEYGPVIQQLGVVSKEEFLEYIEQFKVF